jgi:hypothetical protein
MWDLRLWQRYCWIQSLLALEEVVMCVCGRHVSQLWPVSGLWCFIGSLSLRFSLKVKVPTKGHSFISPKFVLSAWIFPVTSLSHSVDADSAHFFPCSCGYEHDYSAYCSICTLRYLPRPMPLHSVSDSNLQMLWYHSKLSGVSARLQETPYKWVQQWSVLTWTYVSPNLCRKCIFSSLHAFEDSFLSEWRHTSVFCNRPLREGRIVGVFDVGSSAAYRNCVMRSCVIGTEPQIASKWPNRRLLDGHGL